MIRYSGIKKSFHDRPVLDGVDLEVRDGEIFFVLGKTGAGKTVMIRSLVGLVKPDGGVIEVDGEDLTNYGEKEFQSVRRKCGMVFQLPTLFDSLLVFENVAYGLRRLGGLSEEEIGRRVTEALAQVELPAEVMFRMPSELSFGEQKRVGLARTLVLSPRYLLYDEPTTGLDPFTASRIDLLVQRLNREKGRTSIVVSHDLASMYRIADRVGLLDGGVFRFVGTVDEFRESHDPRVMEFRRSARP